MPSHPIIHIPHASMHIPFRDGFLVDEARIEGELLTLADWHTDDLFVDAHSYPFFEVSGYSLGFDYPKKVANRAVCAVDHAGGRSQALLQDGKV